MNDDKDLNKYHIMTSSLFTKKRRNKEREKLILF